MALTAGRDYLYVPLVDYVDDHLSGEVTQSCLLCLPDRFFLFPIKAFQMAGDEAIWRTYGMEGRKAPDYLPEILEDPDMTPQRLQEICTEILGGKPERWIVPLADLDMFKVKTGWFGGGMYLHVRGGKRRTLNIRGKEHKLAVKAYYEGRYVG